MLLKLGASKSEAHCMFCLWIFPSLYLYSAFDYTFFVEPTLSLVPTQLQCTSQDDIFDNVSHGDSYWHSHLHRSELKSNTELASNTHCKKNDISYNGFIQKYTCVHLYSLDSSTVRRKKSRHALQLNLWFKKAKFKWWSVYHSRPKFFPSALFPHTTHIPLVIYFPILKSVIIFNINCYAHIVLLLQVK